MYLVILKIHLLQKSLSSNLLIIADKTQKVQHIIQFKLFCILQTPKWNSKICKNGFTINYSAMQCNAIKFAVIGKKKKASYNWTW